MRILNCQSQELGKQEDLELLFSKQQAQERLLMGNVSWP